MPLHRVTGRGTKQLNFRTNQAMQDYLLQIEQKPKAEFKELL
ncbi:hypothetical protein [Fructilactobacillus florum]|nr:hypothetical protein [Fructilactobacillus florum]